MTASSLFAVQCRWFKLLQQNISPVPLVNLRDLNKSELPLSKPPADFDTPVLVVIGSNDAVVDLEAARETADHFGQKEVVQLPDLAHDLMLVPSHSFLCICHCVLFVHVPCTCCIA